jgi:hypothetical protein
MSLTAKERAMLREFTNPRPNVNPNDIETQQTFALLQQKQLLKFQGSRVTIEPPVFYSFVRNNPDVEL